MYEDNFVVGRLSRPVPPPPLPRPPRPPATRCACTPPSPPPTRAPGAQATGLGAHLALPLLRKAWRADLGEGEARQLLTDCMRVLFYRDTRASAKYTIGKCDASGSSVSEPQALDTYWEHPEFVKGGGHLGDGSW